MRFILFLITGFFFLTATALAAGQVVFPLSQTGQRDSYKSFGQYIDKNFYTGKEQLFPHQFYGYHAGTDWEILPGEENTQVMVYAVADGTVTFAGPVEGYGGVILEKLNGEETTALYGHLNLSVFNLKSGDKVTGGQPIAVLGNAFSAQTGGERKHLHFGLYQGRGLYFKGYETSPQALQNKWLDPVSFLANRGAVSPAAGENSTPAPQPSNILFKLWEFLQSLFR